MSVIHISHLDIGRYENYNIVTEVFCICLFKILNFFKLVYLKNLLNFELDVVCVPNQNHFKITFFLWIVLLLFQTKIVSYTTFWLTISKSDIKLETGTYPEAFIVKSIMRTTWLKQREPFTLFFSSNSSKGAKDSWSYTTTKPPAWPCFHPSMCVAAAAVAEVFLLDLTPAYPLLIAFTIAKR